MGIIDKLRNAREAYKQVLTMNRRNLGYIYPDNPRRHFELADDKLATKEMLQQHGIPHARTLHTYSNFFELGTLQQDLAPLHSFVIKPAHGRAGGGIMVIASRERQGQVWRDIRGRSVTLDHIRKRISDIIFGVYGYDMNDTAIIEETITQHREVDRLCFAGLADVRVISHRDRPVIAMTRLPTRASGGRANLHQGAVGVGVDIASGMTRAAIWNGRLIEHHPDNQVPLTGIQLPWWDRVIDICRHTARVCPLKYLGLDIALGSTGPLVIEINARPGLTIQNANLLGMRSLLNELSQ